MAVLAFVSCSKTAALEEARREVEKEQSEQTLGFAIAPNQLWNMEVSVNLTVANYPKDFKATALAVYDANPLTGDANIIAETEELNSPLSFECPNHLHSLYVGVTDAEGNMRTVPFKPTDSLVDFTAPYYEVTGKQASTRAGEGLPNQSELTWEDSFNKINMADKGWNDQVAVISSASETRVFSTPSRADLLEEYNQLYPGNDVDKFLHLDQSIRSFYYATVGAGGSEITVTPIGSNGTNNSNLYFGYYYFDKGQSHEVKKVKKYLFNECYNGATKWTDECQSYKLVYYDANGNPSYTFPEGTEISFFCRGENVNGCPYDLQWYAEGENNLDLSQYMVDNSDKYNINSGGAHDWWMEANHVVFFERNGRNYVGFEDWIDNFNLKDIVMLFEGNVKAFPALSKPNSLPNHHIYTFAFEDTKNGDYDLNDVVIQVYRGQGGTYGHGINGLHFRLVALGASDPIHAFFYDKNAGQRYELFNGMELHEAFLAEGFKETNGEFVNTEGINFDFSKVSSKSDWNINPLHSFAGREDGSLIHEPITVQDVYIVNDKTGQEIHTPRAINLKGTAPYGLCIPHTWAWPKERVSITKAYPNFTRFATSIEGGSIDVTDWYVYPANSQTISYDFGFTVK